MSMYPIMRAKNRRSDLEQREFTLNSGECLEYLCFPKLARISGLEHSFSTRLGGVSEGEFASMNFSFTRGDNKSHVLENYARMGQLFNLKPEDFVATDQTHTTNIMVVTKGDAGKGITKPRDYSGIDGLITAEKELVLSCFTADCVPIYFVDPVKQVIGVAHSGWRGTVAFMGARMVERMQGEFGCKPEDIEVAIGPSICQDCYEISEEVANQFRENAWTIDKTEKYCREAFEEGLHPNGKLLEEGKKPGKYQLDLWLANMIVLRSAGIPIKNISVTNICTNCNPRYLFSHRASGGKRGNLGAFMVWKESKG